MAHFRILQVLCDMILFFRFLVPAYHAPDDEIFFVDEKEKLVPECMEAGDVLAFAGDTDHCGAEWSKQGGHDAVASFQDCINYRLF